MLSLISNWKNEELRDTILFIGSEEAMFYQPRKASIAVKSFVVVTIRNSIIEDISSTEEAAKKLGLDSSINLDNIMPEITNTAIEYFSNIDFVDISNRFPHPLKDYFVYIPEKYPVAWEAMKNLCNLTKINKRKISYNPIHMPEIKVSDLKRSRIKTNNDGDAILLSGMDPGFDIQTLNHFRQIKNQPRTPFFSDSFKAITRDLDKLFLIIDFFLRIKSPIVTFNFYLDNGYVSTKNKWVKPFHNTFEVNDKLLRENFNDCTGKHKEVLIAIKRTEG